MWLNLMTSHEKLLFRDFMTSQYKALVKSLTFGTAISKQLDDPFVVWIAHEIYHLLPLFH